MNSRIQFDLLYWFILSADSLKPGPDNAMQLAGPQSSSIGESGKP